MSQPQIALIGSPNSGKTSLFNRLTGARQRTGNWPGVTVERKSGRLNLREQSAELVDLPGLYRLDDDGALDAQVARDYLASGQAQLLVMVLDATQLSRQLRLLPQLQATGVPLLLAVNMIDSARAEGIELDLERLEAHTGLRCCPVSAATGEGIAELLTEIDNQLNNRGSEAQSACQCSLLQDDIATLANQVCRRPDAPTRTERIDRWVLHPALALPLFLLVMYTMFSISVNVGAMFIDFFDIWFGSWLVDGSRWALESIGTPYLLTSLISDGIGGGIQLVATFIPVIGCLYLCLSTLEDSGYLSRAAFVIDGLMAKIGLPGQAFMPLILGFGCNVPAVMAARSLDRSSARLATIFIAPFMSCGARLSVYVFVATAIFPEQAALAIFGLYLLGILVAVFSAWLLRHSLFANQQLGRLSEMPAYHRPLLRNILTQTWQRLWSFSWRAGKRIVAVVIGLTLLSSLASDGSFSKPDPHNSMLASIARGLTPALEPIGIGENNWPATVGLFTGLFAKEVVVGTLDSLYRPTETEASATEKPDFIGDFKHAALSVRDNAEGFASTLTNPLGIDTEGLDDLDAQAEAQGVSRATYTAMANLFPSAWAAFCYLVFILIYAPCVATIAAMQREAGGPWLSFAMIWSLLLGYWLASNMWQLSLWQQQPLYSSLWFAGSTAVLALCYRFIARQVQRRCPELIAVKQID